MPVKYVWGVDGLGRAHIAKESDPVVVFCMLCGYCGKIGIWDLEEQK